MLRFNCGRIGFLHFASWLAFSSSPLRRRRGGEPKPSDRRQVTKQVGAQLHKKPNRFASPRGPAPLQVRMRCSEPFFLPQFPIGPSSKTLEHPTLALFWGFLSTFFFQKKLKKIWFLPVLRTAVPWIKNALVPERTGGVLCDLEWSGSRPQK